MLAIPAANGTRDLETQRSSSEVYAQGEKNGRKSREGKLVISPSLEVLAI